MSNETKPDTKAGESPGSAEDKLFFKYASQESCKSLRLVLYPVAFIMNAVKAYLLASSTVGDFAQLALLDVGFKESKELQASFGLDLMHVHVRSICAGFAASA